MPFSDLEIWGLTLPPKGRRARALAYLSDTQRDSIEAGGTLPLMIHSVRYIRSIDELTKTSSDPSLHGALQDLGDTIVHDLTEACAALSNPDIYYAGVDEGIEPVPDEHVALVIAASQRELNRELRGTGPGTKVRPAAPLDRLPWRIKRAFAERRRLRYQQWGIGKAEWEANAWTPLNVPEDPEWIPHRV